MGGESIKRKTRSTDLFDFGIEQSKVSPLALRMRPESLDEFVGQQHLVGPNSLLRHEIETDSLASMILYGPPGTGKTALAHVIAKTTRARFVQLNAVTSTVADLRAVVDEAKQHLKFYGKKTVLFIDEIHRFNKVQQDALLPHVEDGTVILIGATTENPFFEVSPPLLSRSRVLQFKPLDDEEIKLIVLRALSDSEKGLGKYSVKFQEGALDYIVRAANGDARCALNALELAVLTCAPNEDGEKVITLEVARDALQQRVLPYDKNGDAHYNVISAFIKSMRGSDPDATLYWLARMIQSGEDPEFIARRIIICAAEDVGLAEPMALVVATSAFQALQFVGMPEAQLALAEAALFVAAAPKSNSVTMGLSRATEAVKNQRSWEVPVHLRDSSYKGAAQLGHGHGYKYPHNYPEGYVLQEYLPKELAGKVYYEPTNRGYEGKIKAFLDDLRSRKGKVEKES